MSYDSILVFVYQLTQMVYYKLVKTTIDALSILKVIIDIVVWYQDFLDSIITNKTLSLFQNSDYCYVIFLAFKNSFLSHYISKLMTISSSKIV